MTTILENTPWNYDSESDEARRTYKGFVLCVDLRSSVVYVLNDDSGWTIETPQFTGRVPLQHLMAYAERIVMALVALNSFSMAEHWHQVPLQDAKRVQKQRERFLKKSLEVNLQPSEVLRKVKTNDE